MELANRTYRVSLAFMCLVKKDSFPSLSQSDALSPPPDARNWRTSTAKPTTPLQLSPIAIVQVYIWTLRSARSNLVALVQQRGCRDRRYDKRAHQKHQFTDVQPRWLKPAAIAGSWTVGREKNTSLPMSSREVAQVSRPLPDHEQ
jgi:hypothetical protein